MIIFFTSCKNFKDDIIWRQTNAILSWKKLDIDKKIVILGNDLGVSEFCKKHNLINYIGGKKATFSPTLYSMIDYINENKIDDNIILCYLNADIILTESFTEVIKIINNNPILESSLIIGMRNEWFEPENLNLEKNNSLNLELKFLNLNNKSCQNAHDYFIFNKNWNFLKDYMNQEIGVGEPCYDLYIVGTFFYNKRIVIDATNCINAIHQDHGKFNIKNEVNSLDLVWNKNSVKMNLQKKNCKLKEVELYMLRNESSIKKIDLKLEKFKKKKIELKLETFIKKKPELKLETFIKKKPELKLETFIKKKPELELELETFIKKKPELKLETFIKYINTKLINNLKNNTKRKFEKFFKLLINLVLIYFIKNTNIIINLVLLHFIKKIKIIKKLQDYLYTIIFNWFFPPPPVHKKKL